MSTNPRNPYLLPGCVAAVVIAAGVGAGLLAIVDDSEMGEVDRLSPSVVERVRELRTERDWATVVCGALDTWRTRIVASTDSVRDGFDITEPGPTWDLATAAFDDARDATTTMIETVRAAETPDTPAGRDLARGVDDLIDHANGHVESIALRVGSIGGDVGFSDGFNVPALIDDVRALIDDARADIEALREPASEMLTVLRANDECAPFLDVLQLS
jgi:hypothetical protein